MQLNVSSTMNYLSVGGTLREEKLLFAYQQTHVADNDIYIQRVTWFSRTQTSVSDLHFHIFMKDLVLLWNLMDQSRLRTRLSDAVFQTAVMDMIIFIWNKEHFIIHEDIRKHLPALQICIAVFNKSFVVRNQWKHYSACDLKYSLMKPHYLVWKWAFLEWTCRKCSRR